MPRRCRSSVISTPRSLDAIAATGEMLSSLLVVAAYGAAGSPADAVEAQQVMMTDATFTKAEPRPDAIAAAAASTSCRACGRVASR